MSKRTQVSESRRRRHETPIRRQRDLLRREPRFFGGRAPAYVNEYCQPNLDIVWNPHYGVRTSAPRERSATSRTNVLATLPSMRTLRRGGGLYVRASRIWKHMP
jgi:hypothetical protein